MAQDSDVGKLERDALVSYGSASLAYYDGYHPTSRFFDQLIARYVAEAPLKIAAGSTWLDIGSGRGRLREYAPATTRFTVVNIDLSELMLRHGADQNNARRILGSALHIPLRDTSVDGIASFLGDPFNVPEFFSEAFRVLKASSELIHVVPSKAWGVALRRARDLSVDQARFLGRSKQKLEAPSILQGDEDLNAMVRNAGFSEVSVVELKPTGEEAKLAQRVVEVEIARRNLGLRAEELSVLSVVRARR